MLMGSWNYALPLLRGKWAVTDREETSTVRSLIAISNVEGGGAV